VPVQRSADSARELEHGPAHQSVRLRGNTGQQPGQQGDGSLMALIANPHEGTHELECCWRTTASNKQASTDIT
jgi:hypothetical protein